MTGAPPLPRVPAPVAVSAAADALRLTVPPVTALDALAAAAAASTPFETAMGGLAPLCALPGVRAGAVVRSEGEAVVVVASLGYDCSFMGPGAVLPLSARLPVTEAVRRGKAGVQAGPDGGWLALPFTDRPRSPGALLLSLEVAAPSPADQALLARVTRALGAALTRAERAERVEVALAELESGLVPASSPDGVLPLDVAIRSAPFAGTAGGDLVEVAAVRGVSWLLLADVAGKGHAAAGPATRLRAAARALLPDAASPAELLGRLDAAIDTGPEQFATALALRIEGDQVLAASAGHPLPLLIVDGEVREPEALAPAAPLGLALGPCRPAEARWSLPAGATLVAWTDGLTDRRPELDVAAELRRLPVTTSSARLADALLASAQARESDDDVSLLVLRRTL